MTQRSLKRLSLCAATPWMSAILVAGLTLATGNLLAEKSTSTDTSSAENPGLLWLSPESEDFEEHIRQARLAALPSTPEDRSVNVAKEDVTDLSEATDEVRPADDTVEEVFADVLDEMGIETSKETTTDAAVERIAAKPETTKPTTTAPAAKPSDDSPVASAPANASAAESKAAESTAAVADTSAEPAPVISKETQPPARVIPSRVARLRKPIEECLRLYEPQLLNSGEHSCWSMMHSYLGWGRDSHIRIGSEKGRRTSVLNWLCRNQPCAGRRLFYVSNGRIKGREGPGYQGHAGQFLAMAAQTDTPRGTPIRVQGNDFTIDELIKEEQLTCREPSELTFKLIGFAHYLDLDTKWRNDRGESWDLPRVIRAELAQPINGAACGGTHRIMGLTYAVKKRKAAGQSIEGQWWRAEKFVNDYYAYSLSLQNRDGSFSSDWFKRRGNWGGKDRKLQTTGHILEWMVYASSEEQLLDERITRSVAFLTNVMVQHRYHEWEYGPKGHAVRALRLYHERVFGGDWKRPTNLVKRNSKGLSRLRLRRK